IAADLRLTRRNIRFVKFGGLKFLDATQVKDLLAVLHFIANPRDRASGFRAMQLIPGVGPGVARRVLDYIMPAAEPLGVLADAPRPPRAGEHRTGFLEMVADLHHGQSAYRERHVYAARTRFTPIDNLLGLFDRTAWPTVAAEPAAQDRRRRVCGL